jgi:hypothetical protein
MKIKYQGKGHTLTPLKDLLSELFYIGRYEWDEADYGFSIVLFGRSWDWLIYKDEESFFEYQQLKNDQDARHLKWQYENGEFAND